MDFNPIDIINLLLALVAAFFAGLGVYLSRAYHKTNLLRVKSENLQKFINISWLLFSDYSGIQSALKKSDSLGAKFVPDKNLLSAIEIKLKELAALGTAISISELFSDDVKKDISDIYSLFKSVFDHPINLDEITTKVKKLQRLYDTGKATK